MTKRVARCSVDLQLSLGFIGQPLAALLFFGDVLSPRFDLIELLTIDVITNGSAYKSLLNTCVKHSGKASGVFCHDLESVFHPI